MGIMSKIRDYVDRKSCEVIETKKEPVKETAIEKPKKEKEDIARVLAKYIAMFEILAAEYLDESNEFFRVYDKFRKDYDIERLISAIDSYDNVLKDAYVEVKKWSGEI